MTLQEALAQLEALSNETTRKHNTKNGAGHKQFGVKHGDVRKLAAKIKPNPPLAAALWETGNIDAQLLAILLMRPKDLSTEEITRLLRGVDFVHVADWLFTNIIKPNPNTETLREPWMRDPNPWVARAGWNLTAVRISKNPDGLEMPALLDRLEREIPGAAPETQWTMNYCLAGIGIHHPKHRARAVAIGETLGLYRDYPVSKGCTSPFAPIWIGEMVRRQG